MALAKNWILGVSRIQKNQNSRLLDVWPFRARYHRFCEGFIKENSNFPKLDFEAEHGTQDSKNSKFPIFRFWPFWARYHRFCEEFIKGNGTCPKLDFGPFAFFCRKPCKYCCFWPWARAGTKPGTEPAGIRVSTLRFPFPRSHSLENPSTKVCGKKEA